MNAPKPIRSSGFLMMPLRVLSLMSVAWGTCRPRFVRTGIDRNKPSDRLPLPELQAELFSRLRRRHRPLDGVNGVKEAQR